MQLLFSRIIIVITILSLAAENGCGKHQKGGGGDSGTVPPPVSNLVATVVSSSQVNLSWTYTATTQTGFLILRSQDGVVYTTVGTAAANATSFQDAYLFPLVTYWYIVQATNASGNSPSSNVASITTLSVSWAHLTPSGTLPAPRVNMSGIVDAASNQFLVFSGDDGSLIPPGNKETLALNLSGVGSPDWTTLASGPSVRQFYSFVYLPGPSGGGILFGGFDGTGPTNQTWLLNPSTGWSVLSTAGAPPTPRLGHVAVLAGQKMYIFGGQNANPPPNNLLNDLTVLDFSLSTPTWSPVNPSGTPPSLRAFHSGVFDSGNDQLVFFGGQDTSNNSLNDTWALSLSGTPTWTALTFGGIPPAGRYGTTAVYNGTSKMMVVFGGNFTVSSGNDVWFLSLSGTPVWKQITPAGSVPPPRGGHAAALDLSAGRMLIFSGQDISTFALLGDVWALDF